MDYEAKKTEHCGPKRGNGAYRGYKWKAKKESNRIRRELDDYRGRTMGLRMALERDVPRTMGLLDRTISSLDSYVERSQQPDSGASAAEPSAGEAS